MNTGLSKLTSKYQATIPAAIRQRLHLKAGDVIVFDVSGEQVRIRKAQKIDLQFANAIAPTLTEWESAADDEAYRDL